MLNSRMNGLLQKYPNIFIRSLLALGFFYVIYFSIWQGLYNLDPHHWGLMFSNAVDLINGKTPYKEIFIQYGILTTIIHAVAYILITKSLISIIAITAFFYACGLIGIYFLGHALTNNKRIAVFSFITCVIFHPLAIYPWSNYISFPFLVFGLLFLINGKPAIGLKFLSGILFSFAMLSRENLFIPVVVISVLASVVVFVDKSLARNIKIRVLVAYWCGLLAPILIFFGALSYFNIYDYWYKYSVDLPRLYSRFFMGDGVQHALIGIIKYIVGKNFRKILLLLLFISYLASCAAFIFKPMRLQRNKLCFNAGIFITSVFGLLLMSSAIHLHEIFRISTGMTIGMPVLFYWASSLSNNKKPYILQYDVLILSLFVVFCIVTFPRQSKAGNPFYPTSAQLSESLPFEGVQNFKYQRWSADAINYYNSVNNDFTHIVSLKCNVKFIRNDTKDAFISVLSPFVQYQVAPFGRGFSKLHGFDELRPDFKIDEKIRSARDIVIVTAPEDGIGKSFIPPANFSIYSKYVSPKSYFFTEDSVTYILIPTRCMSNI